MLIALDLLGTLFELTALSFFQHISQPQCNISIKSIKC